jgi:hypothetical protein
MWVALTLKTGAGFSRNQRQPAQGSAGGDHDIVKRRVSVQRIAGASLCGQRRDAGGSRPGNGHRVHGELHYCLWFEPASLQQGQHG